jgi:predicted acyltransferase
MINPAKASYSIAPTIVVCTLAGYLTAKMFLVKQRPHRLLLIGLVGLLIGLAVNFRLPNLFLSSGYFLFFFASFLLSRKIETALQGMVFGAAFWRAWRRRWPRTPSMPAALSPRPTGVST